MCNRHAVLSTPKLVLLPGLHGTEDLLGPFLAALPSEARYAIVQYSSPLRSDYFECEAAAREALPPSEPYVLVGESFSGPVAISIASAKPPGLCGIVLVGSFAAAPSPMLKYLAPLISRLPMNRLAGRFMATSLLGSSASSELRRSVRDVIAQMSPSMIGGRVRALSRVDVTENLRRITIPVLYLRATRDRLVPPQCAQQMMRLSSQVRLIDLDGPHMLLSCAPHECARAIVTFAHGCQAYVIESKA